MVQKLSGEPDEGGTRRRRVEGNFKLQLGSLFYFFMIGAGTFGPIVSSSCFFLFPRSFFSSLGPPSFLFEMDGLLNKATTADENPTPGYVFSELAKIQHADASTTDKMADFLFKRLARSEPSVKWKVLVVMKQVCKLGRMEFRRALQKQNEKVKEALSFKGPPDPLRGDEPNAKVRSAAKDALEAMFDSNAPATSGAAAGGALSGRITGMGGGAFPPAASSAFPPAASSRGGGGGGGFSTALPGTPGYDPNSPMHAPPQSSGTMQGFGNYDPGKEKSGPYCDTRMPSPTHPPPPPPPPL